MPGRGKKRRRSAAAAAEEQIILTEESAELSSLLKRTYDELIGSLPADVKADTAWSLQGYLEELGSDEHCAKLFSDRCAGAMKKILKDPDNQMSGEEALELLDMYLPYVLVYVAMGHSHSVQLTKAEQAAAKKLFAGCQTFKSFAQQYFAKALGKHPKHKLLSEFDATLTFEHNCSC